MNKKLILGTNLPVEEQKRALAMYVHRYTGDHKPAWARLLPTYSVQFKNDTDWLANTKFVVTKYGKLRGGFHACESSPTWPDGKPGAT